MRNQVGFFAICALLCCGGLLNAQSVASRGQWQRIASVDQLTQQPQVMYRFAQSQPDGSFPAIMLFCAGGHVTGENARLFTDQEIYYDPTPDIAVSAVTVPDVSKFLVGVKYRGGSGKIYSSSEWVNVADPRAMTLTGKELQVFGQTGTLVIQFPNSRGYLVTDTFQQARGSGEQAAVMAADCFSPKRARR